MRCTGCNGLKKKMKLGMQMGECETCKGTGLEIKKEEPEPKPISEINPEPIQPVQASKDATHVKKDHKNNKRKK